MKKTLFSFVLSMILVSPVGAQQTGTASPELRERLRQDFKARVEMQRTGLKNLIEQQRTQLKERLAKVRDERKKQAVERIAQRLEELNENRVKHFTEVLNKLDKILERIIARADRAVSRGLDVTVVREAINAARAAITAGRDAIQAQAAKTYQIAVTTEDKLRADVEAARKALHNDLVKVRDAVKTARDAVHNAATTLAKIPRVDEKPSATTPNNTQ